jgi:autotransporter-associated beta strand protein
MGFGVNLQILIGSPEGKMSSMPIVVHDSPQNRAFWFPVFLFLVFVGVSPARSQTWLPTPTSGDWNTLTNWDTGVVPNSSSAIATFGFSNTTGVINAGAVSLGSLQFNVGASSYSVTNSTGQLSFFGQGIVDQSGVAQKIVNNSSLLFYNSSTAGDVQITNGLGVTFFNNSGAGSALITNNALLSFNDNSTAQTAQIQNNGSLSFSTSASAGHAILHNAGTMSFSNNSTAGSSALTNNGFTDFTDSSTAATALITNNAGLQFDTNASAGNANILNNDSLVFTENATAGSASITNYSSLDFNGSSTAGMASITNNSFLDFNYASSAATAVVTTLTGGKTDFSQTASGEDAQFITNAGGTFDISQVTTGAVTVGSISGAGAYDLGGNDLMEGANNLDTMVSGVIADGGVSAGAGGSLTKTGTGTLTLSGENTYSGGTTVAQGTLDVDTGGSLGTGQVFNNSTLNYIDAATAANSSITNNHFLNFQQTATAGAATITNTGSSILQFSNTSTAGNALITTNSGAGVWFYGNASGDTAQFTFNGTGILDISGSNAPVTTGSISGVGDYFLGSNDLVVGVNNLSTTVSGVFQDGGVNGGVGGSLTKSGTGTLTLSGNNIYSGGTTVAQGILAVGSTQALGMGSLAVDGGTLETSGGPSTIQVKSNYLQASGGTLLLTLDNGQQDAVSVGGTAIVGGTLALAYGNGFQLNLGDSVTVITANGLSGLYNQWNNPAGGRLFPIYNSTQVSLESVLPTFQISGLTPNEKAVAGALDNSFEDSAHYPLILNLVGQSNAALPGIYHQIDPSGLTALYQMNFNFSRSQAALADQRLEAAALQDEDSPSAWRQGDVRFAGNLPASQDQALAQNLSHPNQWGSFVSGSGDFGTLSGDGNASGYNFTVSGLTAGADYGFGTDLTAGILLGFAQGTADNNGGGEVDFTGGQLGFYGGWRNHGIHAEILVEGGLNSFKYQQAGFGGMATASPTGQDYSGNLDLGYDFKIEKLKVGPFASVQYTYTHFGAFNEVGSNAPLAFSGQGEGSFISDLGANFVQELNWDSTTLNPGFSAAWEHVYQGYQDSLNANLGSASESFAVVGPATGQNALVLGIGLAASLKDGPAFFARYQGKVGMTNYTEQNLEGGVKIGF